MTTPAALRVAERPGWRLPHRDFSVEYPPLAWLAFLPPALVVDSASGYRVLFGILMALLVLVSALLAVRLRERFDGPGGARSSVGRAAWLALMLGPILVMRFDALPALACIAAVYAAVSQRWGWCGLAIGAGAAAKFYPILLLPALLAAAVGAGARRGAMACLMGSLAGGVVFVPFLILAPRGLFADLGSRGVRPLQIESVLATPFLFSGAAQLRFGFGSANLEAPGTAVAAHLSPPLLAALLALAAVLAYRCARVDPRRAGLDGAIVSLLAALAASKVLSPQYLIWLFPLAVAAPGRSGKWFALLFGAAALATQIWYPYLYARVMLLELPVVVLVASRNLLLVTALAVTSGAQARASVHSRV